MECKYCPTGGFGDPVLDLPQPDGTRIQVYIDIHTLDADVVTSDNYSGHLGHTPINFCPICGADLKTRRP